MADRGRKRKPSALTALSGGKPSADEPIPSAGEVLAPTDLSLGAREVWDRLAPDLIAKGVLTPWDVDEFAALCDAVERHDRSRHHLDLDGEVVESPVFDRNGKQTGVRQQLSPWWQVWKGANEVILRYGARFGLSPAERAHLKVGHGRNDQGSDLLT